MILPNPLDEPFKKVSFTAVTFTVLSFDVRFNVELPKLRHCVGLDGGKMKGPILWFCLGCCLCPYLHLLNLYVISYVKIVDTSPYVSKALV